jgi:chloramphenicol O-acetyltransferase
VEPTSQRWPFFRKRNIYNDLMNIQQGLINNNSYAKRKFKRYFIWPYDQCTNGCAKFRSKIRCEYICANLQKIGFIISHTEKYRKIDNKVKISGYRCS